MCYMVSRIGGSLKNSCVEFLLILGPYPATRSYAPPEGCRVLMGRRIERDRLEMDGLAMKELETLQTLMLWSEKDAKRGARKRLHSALPIYHKLFFGNVPDCIQNSVLQVCIC